jgi:hypothetical protein
MRAVWAQRREELLSDCVVSPHVFEPMVDRLCDFAVPYQQCLETEAGKRNVHRYLEGLLSHLDRKNVEGIAALVDVQRLVVYLSPAAKYDRLTRRPSQGQKGLDERAIMASQWPSHPW